MTHWSQLTAEGRERNRMAQKRYLYGLSAADYEALLVKQEGRCAGCGRGETRMWKGKVRSLCIDHCHTTGLIRGLLCDDCNGILSRAKDSPATLRRLAAYLEVSAGAPSRYINADEALTELMGGA